MKPKSSLKSVPLSLGLLVAGFAVPSAQAQSLWWDENSDAAGFGSVTGSTNWSSSTSLFSTSATGVLVPSGTLATTTSNQATFGADTTGNGLGGGTITVSGTVDIGTIRHGRGTGQGAVTLSGGTINFGATGTIIGAASILTINSAITGAGTTLNVTANLGAGGTNLGGGYNGGGTLNISGSSSTTLTAGTYTVASVTSANSNGRNLNLNGGTLNTAGNVFASGVAGNIDFNGGTLRSNNAAGITVFDNNNSIAIGAGGATFDTTIGNITLGSGVGMTGTGTRTFVGATGNTFTANTMSIANGTPLGFNLGSVSINNVVPLVSLTTLNEALDGGSYTVDFNGFNFNSAGTYKLFGFSSISGTLVDTDFIASNSTVGSGLSAGFLIDSSSLSYVVSVIPEPSTFAAFAGVLALGFAASRRRSV